MALYWYRMNFISKTKYLFRVNDSKINRKVVIVSHLNYENGIYFEVVFRLIFRALINSFCQYFWIPLFEIKSEEREKEKKKITKTPNDL